MMGIRRKKEKKGNTYLTVFLVEGENSMIYDSIHNIGNNFVMNP
jgi:hypothetical protein